MQFVFNGEFIYICVNDVYGADSMMIAILTLCQSLTKPGLHALEEVFSRSVDLVEEQTITNKYLRQNVDSSMQLIYGA